VFTKTAELENSPLTTNSRSYLNRWTSPDTIVPFAAQGTQAFDRYAYVNNNPVRFADPTGHLLCSEVPWEENCDPYADAQIISLARRGGLTDDGEHMLQLFLNYRNTSGWWNEDGNFALDEFLGLTLYYEYADTPADGIGYFTEAVGRKLSWWCKETGCSNDTASMLNYIGTRAAMRSRYAATQYNDASLADQTRSSYGLDRFYDAIGMGQNAATNPAWKSGAVGYNVPWDWGNLSMFPVDARVPMTKINKFNLISSYSIVYRYGVDPNTAFVIVTFNQETYWKSNTAK
jgi:RHS repeat-associated protein